MKEVSTKPLVDAIDIGYAFTVQGEFIDKLWIGRDINFKDCYRFENERFIRPRRVSSYTLDSL